jgi:hypothetical protein
MSLVQVEKWSRRIQNVENTKCICFSLDSQVLLVLESRHVRCLYYKFGVLIKYSECEHKVGERMLQRNADICLFFIVVILEKSYWYCKHLFYQILAFWRLK